MIKYHGYQYHGLNVESSNPSRCAGSGEASCRTNKGGAAAESTVSTVESAQSSGLVCRGKSECETTTAWRQGNVFLIWSVYSELQSGTDTISRWNSQKISFQRNIYQFSTRVYNKIRKGWIPLNLIFQEIICAIISDVDPVRLLCILNELRIVPDKNVRSNDARDPGMGDRIEAIQRPQVRILPFRRVVHGIRYRADFYLPLLASSGLQWHTDSIWCCLCDQSHFRDIRLLLQL